MVRLAVRVVDRVVPREVQAVVIKAARPHFEPEEIGSVRLELIIRVGLHILIQIRRARHHIDLHPQIGGGNVARGGFGGLAVHKAAELKRGQHLIGCGKVHVVVLLDKHGARLELNFIYGPGNGLRLGAAVLPLIAVLEGGGGGVDARVGGLRVAGELVALPRRDAGLLLAGIG